MLVILGDLKQEKFSQLGSANSANLFLTQENENRTAAEDDCINHQDKTLRGGTDWPLKVSFTSVKTSVQIFYQSSALEAGRQSRHEQTHK